VILVKLMLLFSENSENKMEFSEKCDLLKRNIYKTGGLAVAFSGGVDSSLIAAVAQQELGSRALAVTALSPTYSTREQKFSAILAKQIGIKHITVESNELDIPEFADNPENRCYYCKRELFAVVKEIANEHGIGFVADGTNIDDLNDHRPGMKAADEAAVLQPLLDAGFLKEDVRRLSREMNLPTADKPAMACLASRFPYGSRITEEKIWAIDKVENSLRNFGFCNIRVRHHGDIVRIEVGEKEIARLCLPEIRMKLIAVAKSVGFLYVTADLQGYRTGSMNEGL